MTPEEINAAVARKLGWEIQVYPKDMVTYDRPVFAKRNGEDMLFLPDYCGSIQAAWELTSTFRKWSLSFDGNHLFSWVDDDGLHCVRASSAPEAICDALLKKQEVPA